ncbi:DUF3343 domain-containing protein [Anaerophilus nitritogenes]|uniref:DUF3343 domain-containing protein n=1 Tax=Anaerophilus nitritogenes TaxID=2498136 RepID=UPI0013EA94CD|nr:DUF3343 domain-containing protein [Anaerophilus nitritogenes]
MMYEKEKYLIVFTSNYHGYYMEELFRRNNIKNTFRKAPRAVGQSCHTAIYIQEKDLELAIKLILKCKILPQGIYEIISRGSLLDYKKLEIQYK